MARLRQQTGSAVVTALLASVVMLLLGVALLAIVDSQARQSGAERTRDRVFNLSESVLSSQAFVLGRSWPTLAPDGDPACSDPGTGFADTIGSAEPAAPAVDRLRPNLNASYGDEAYRNARWQVNLCDDIPGSPVWSDAVLTRKAWDANRNSLLWVRAHSVVGGTPRTVVGLVRARDAQVLDPKYALVAGRVTDDLGTALGTLSQNALGGVLSGLLPTTPTVAPDPTRPATSPPSSGVTGVRCGALDLQVVPPVTCLQGTLGALGALPAVSNLVTGGTLEQFPRRTAASPEMIDRLRAQAVNTRTHYASSPGSGNPETAPACTFTGNTGTRSASTVVFLEQVGAGDDYCVLDVSAGVQFKALVIGKGRIVLRGNGQSTGTPSATATGPQVNTFSGVVYALNQQRLPADEGGMGLGDAATPGREVVRIDRGAHVKGAVLADGRSGSATVIPPPLDIDDNALVDTLIPCTRILVIVDCTLRNTLKALGASALLNELTRILGVNAVVNGILGQLQPQRAQYGSAVVADVAAINKLTVYGTSGIVTGTFRDIPSS